MLGVGRAGACWQAEQTTVGGGLGAMRPNEPDDADRDAWVVLDGVFGARLTGGGFGGSVVVLVRRGDERRVAAALAAGYQAKIGREAEVLVPA